jgi:hypothetical protein
MLGRCTRSVTQVTQIRRGGRKTQRAPDDQPVVRLALSFTLAVFAAGPAAAEQDLLLGADMSSPAMTKAEMVQARSA